MQKTKLAYFILAILFFTSCDKSIVFDENKEIPLQSWNYKNRLPFDAIVNDTAKYYNVLLNLRINGNYKYSNIFVWVHETSPDKTIEKTRVELSLADDAGRWFGKGLGDLFDYNIAYKTKIKFHTTGVYRFEIEQNMRDDDLLNVAAAGIRIDEWESE